MTVVVVGRRVVDVVDVVLDVVVMVGSEVPVSPDDPSEGEQATTRSPMAIRRLIVDNLGGTSRYTPSAGSCPPRLGEEPEPRPQALG
jgi:hypothetical protein